MNVTDEMEERAFDELHCYATGHPSRSDVRSALEAALADVPEPHTCSAIDKLEDMQAVIDAERVRIAELEAQVRALLQPPLPTGGELDEYHYAPGGEGRYAAEWADKPHRLLFDVIGLARRALGRNGELEAQLAKVRAWLEQAHCECFSGDGLDALDAILKEGP